MRPVSRRSFLGILGGALTAAAGSLGLHARQREIPIDPHLIPEARRAPHAVQRKFSDWSIENPYGVVTEEAEKRRIGELTRRLARFAEPEPRFPPGKGRVVKITQMARRVKTRGMI